MDLAKLSDRVTQSLDEAISADLPAAERDEILKIVPDRHWQNPTTQQLRDEGYNELAQAVAQYQGGIHRFRELLQQQNQERPRGYWQDEQNCIDEALVAMEKEGWETLPEQRTLRERGYSDLTVAVRQYHGDFQRFRAALEEQSTSRPAENW